MLINTSFEKDLSKLALEGWDAWKVGGRFKREGLYVYLWLTHADVWQKPTQHRKAIILQLKTNFKQFKTVKNINT